MFEKFKDKLNQKRKNLAQQRKKLQYITTMSKLNKPKKFIFSHCRVEANNAICNHCDKNFGNQHEMDAILFIEHLIEHHYKYVNLKKAEKVKKQLEKIWNKMSAYETD